MDISPKAQNTQNKIYKPYEAQEETPKCDASVLPRRGKEINMGAEGREGPGREKGWEEGERRTRSGIVWGKRNGSPGTSRKNGNIQPWEVGG